MRIPKEVCLQHSIASGGMDTLKGWNVTDKKIRRFFAEKFGVTVTVGGKTYVVKKKEAMKFLQQSSEYKDKKLNNSKILNNCLQDFRNTRATKMLLGHLENGKSSLNMPARDFQDAMRVLLKPDKAEELIGKLLDYSFPKNADKVSIEKADLCALVRGETPRYSLKPKKDEGVVGVMGETGGIQDTKYNFINDTELGKRFAAWTEQFLSSGLSDK